jgi:hypothetical protein
MVQLWFYPLSADNQRFSSQPRQWLWFRLPPANGVGGNLGVKTEAWSWENLSIKFLGQYASKPRSWRLLQLTTPWGYLYLYIVFMLDSGSVKPKNKKIILIYWIVLTDLIWENQRDLWNPFAPKCII